MQRHQTVVLRERGRLAALVSPVVHRTRRQPGWREPDRRTSRTWRQFVPGLVVVRSTRLVAVGQAVLVAATRAGPLAVLREQATAMLKRLAVFGRRLTDGKLADAIGLDYHRHRRAWATVWLT